MVDNSDDGSDHNGPDTSVTGSDARTTRRIQTLAIFFVGIGAYVAVGTGLDQSALLAENMTTYFVSGLVVLGIGTLLALLTRL